MPGLPSKFGWDKTLGSLQAAWAQSYLQLLKSKAKKSARRKTRRSAKLVLELWQAAKLRSWPRQRCLAQRSVKSTGITRSESIYLREKGWLELGEAVGLGCFLLYELFSSYLLVCRMCVDSFTASLLWAKVEAWKGNDSICFCWDSYFHQMAA